MVTSIKSITDLDDYSLLEILVHIRNIREKIRLKRVCRRFYYLSTESLRFQHKSIKNRHDVYYESERRLFARNERRVHFPFDKILRACPNLTEFNSSALDRICWNTPRLPKQLSLERLTLYGWSNVKMSKSIVERCPQLKSLGLGCTKMGRNFTDYKTDLTIIKSDRVNCLNLRGIHYSLDNIRQFMIDKGNNLETFYYSSCLISSAPSETNFFTNLISIVFDCCPNLKKMELKLVEHDGFGPLSSLSPLNYLSSLIIKTERRAFNYSLLEVILQATPSLQSILIFSNYIGEEDVARLCKKHCPTIKKIDHRPFNWSYVDAS